MDEIGQSAIADQRIGMTQIVHDALQPPGDVEPLNLRHLQLSDERLTY